MKSRTLLVVLCGLIAVVTVACATSEISWSTTDNSVTLRQIVGLPSIAIGNLNPSARNPGLEVLCTAFNDAPGGYCYYFTDGVPYINFTIVSITSEGP
jgi:hypothetical protein